MSVAQETPKSFPEEIAKDKVIFCTPSSTGAVGLAMEKIILPELGHIVMELQKDL